MNRNQGINVWWIGLTIFVSVILAAFFTEVIRGTTGNQTSWAIVIGVLAIFAFVPLVVVGRIAQIPQREIASAGICIWLSVMLTAVFAGPIREFFVRRDWSNFFSAIVFLLIFVFIPLIAFNWSLTIRRSTAQLAIVLVAVIVAAGASAVVLLKRGPAMNATATVRVHDAETINLSDYENRITPYLPAGASIDVSGTFTVNLFSVTNVAVKLHNKTADEWITIVEGQTITDMTQSNDLVAAISSGTYDRVSMYIGTMTLDVSWTEITINPTNFPDIPDNIVTVPAGSYSGSVTSNQTFEIPLATEVVVIEGENQVFDVDTGAPLSPLGILYYLRMGENNLVGENSMDATNMSARGL